ncbi:MAG: helix-turn-helix domain-containing protein [Candidatus Gracilibacteria bacterium]|jgi:sugar-specific transcriptional regulator TrmB
MFEDKLCQIGFTHNEAVIYLELLKMGPQPVSTLAKMASINRTTTYTVLRSLEKKGVVSSYYHGKVQFFVGGDPNILVGYIDRKCQLFDYYRQEVLSMVPQFRKLSGNYVFKKPTITYFEGVEGIKHVMNDSTRNNGLLFSFCPLHKWLNGKLKNFFFEYWKDLKVNSKTRILLLDLPEIKEHLPKINILSCFKSAEVLFFNSGCQNDMFENQINIYDDKVTIIHVDRAEEYGIMIQSKDFYKAQKTIFETIWSEHEKNKKTTDSIQK